MENAIPKYAYLYDETNVMDDPGAMEVVVQRGLKRVQRVQNHSKQTIRIKACWNADGKLLLPWLFTKHPIYTKIGGLGGPLRAVYYNFPSCWFDVNLFEQ